MAIEAGRVVLTAGGIETLEFDFSESLDTGEIVVGIPTIEIIRIEGKDIIETQKPDVEIYTTETVESDDTPTVGAWREDDDPEKVYRIAKTGTDLDNAFQKYNFELPSANSVKGGIEPKEKQIVSIVVRAKPEEFNEKVVRDDGALDSIWEVICRVRTSPGGMTDSGSMIVVGAG